MEFGDVEKGFKEADVIVEENIRISDQCHCYAEQHIAVAIGTRLITLRYGCHAMSSSHA